MEDFKYLAIVEWVKKVIAEEQLPAGKRFYSENELCDIHGVSRQTVRQALAMLESQNVLWRRRGSGTFVKGSGYDASPASNICTVGVISTYFSDYIFPSIVTGIERVLKSNSIGMQLSITHNQVGEESSALEAMLAQNIGGLIIEPSKSALPNPNSRLYEEIKTHRVPLVFFNAKYPWADFPCVAMDDVAAGRIITDHLFDLGHTKIAAIFALDDIQGHNRCRGFMQSFENHGVKQTEQNIIWYSTDEKKSLFAFSEKRIAAVLRSSTAVVCYNDGLAISLLDFCKKQNIKVPEELCVTGIDDSKLASVCDVPLTTVHHPHQLLGETAAQKLLDIISFPRAAASDILMEPKLIKRRSAIKLSDMTIKQK